MNFRLDPEIKEHVTRAAEITGHKLTDFVVSALNEKADEVLGRHESLLLTSEDYEFLIGALYEDQEMLDRSRTVAECYQRGRHEDLRYRLAGCELVSTISDNGITKPR